MGAAHSIERGRGQEIRVQAKEWNGRGYIDIRLYVKPEDGTEHLPTKKGVTVPPDLVRPLMRALEAVAEAEDIPF